jgi:type I restriction enzyme, R subunit
VAPRPEEDARERIDRLYRLIKFAGARRVLFLVDRGNLGRQTKKEFDQYVSPYNNYKFGEEYIVQHLTSNNLDKTARVCISTIQRMYSMLKGRELPEDLEEESTERVEVLFKETRAHRLQPRDPDRDFRHHRHRRGAPLHLQPVAPGAGVLRRLPHRPHRHAQQADLRLLQPEPGDGVRPPAGGGRRRERQLRRLPHPHRGHRGRQQGGSRLLAAGAGQAHPRPARLAARRRLRVRRPKSSTASVQTPDQIRTIVRTFATSWQTDLFPGSAPKCPRR